jgi:hypothetical protein
VLTYSSLCVNILLDSCGTQAVLWLEHRPRFWYEVLTAVTMKITYCLLRCDGVHSGNCLPTFRRKVLPSSSVLKNKLSKNQTEVLAVVNLMFTALVGLLGLIFGSEGYGSTFLRNTGELRTHPTT